MGSGFLGLYTRMFLPFELFDLIVVLVLFPFNAVQVILITLFLTMSQVSCVRLARR